MKIINKYKTFWNYMIIGIIGSIFNIELYMLLIYFFKEQYILCNIITYIISLIIIFTLNKIFVFKDKNNNLKYIIKQFSIFGLSRILSLSIDTFVLFICVDKLLLSDLISKIIANAGTTVLNYFVSKIYIFNKAPKK